MSEKDRQLPDPTSVIRATAYSENGLTCSLKEEADAYLSLMASKRYRFLLECLEGHTKRMERISELNCQLQEYRSKDWESLGPFGAIAQIEETRKATRITIELGELEKQDEYFDRVVDQDLVPVIVLSMKLLDSSLANASEEEILAVAAEKGIREDDKVDPTIEDETYTELAVAAFQHSIGYYRDVIEENSVQHGLPPEEIDFYMIVLFEYFIKHLRMAGPKSTISSNYQNDVMIEAKERISREY